MCTDLVVVFFVATAPDAYEYVGCFRDRQNRALSVAHVYDRQDLTIERCYNFCMAKSTKYFAVQVLPALLQTAGLSQVVKLKYMQ